jgi:hypothetical protein
MFQAPKRARCSTYASVPQFGRGSGFKSRKVWVRVPPEAHFQLPHPLAVDLGHRTQAQAREDREEAGHRLRAAVRQHRDGLRCALLRPHSAPLTFVLCRMRRSLLPSARERFPAARWRHPGRPAVHPDRSRSLAPRPRKTARSPGGRTRVAGGPGSRCCENANGILTTGMSYRDRDASSFWIRRAVRYHRSGVLVWSG